MSSYWFQFLSIDLAPIKKQSSDGVSCPGCLHRGGRHIQEVLEHTKTKKSPRTHAGFSGRTKMLKTTKIPANATGVKSKIKIKKNYNSTK